MSADEMFLKMRYEIIVESNTKIQYEYTGQFFDKEIIFELIDKRVVMELSTGGSCGMSMQELAAINKKVEELRLEQRGEIRMDIDKIENNIALKYGAIEDLKKIKERVKESETEDIRIKIETKHWWGYTEPHLGKEHHAVYIGKTTMQMLLDAMINKEREVIDKLIDMEIEARGRSDTKQ